MNTNILYIFTVLTLTCCINREHQKDSAINDSVIIPGKIATDSIENKFDGMEIICDSIYKDKGYKLTLEIFDTTNEDETRNNTIVTLYKLENGSYIDIFKDSIFNKVQEVKFEDYNNDNIKDILVQNFSDVRSNWTYYLYLVDPANDKVKRVKGFEEIKNPEYNSDNRLVENYVMSGRNWTEFYKIKGDSVFDYGITIYDGEDDNGKVTYDKDYKKAIKTILKKEKKLKHQFLKL